MELFSVTDPAEVRAGLPTDPDTGVATLEVERTGLGAELVVTGVTAEPGTLVVGALSQAGLLAGNTGLRTGKATLGVTTAGLAFLGTEAGQTPGLSAGVTTRQRTTTHLTTGDMEPGPVTVTTVPSTLVAALKLLLTPSSANRRPVGLVTLDAHHVATLQLLLDVLLAPGGGARLVGTVHPAQTEGERVTKVTKSY